MKLRSVFLGSKEPLDWTIGEGTKEERKGKTYKVSLLLDNTDTVLLKVPEKFHQDLVKGGIKQFAVLDVVFEPRVVLDINRNGRPEQLLKIMPTSFEVVAASVMDQPKVIPPVGLNGQQPKVS